MHRPGGQGVRVCRRPSLTRVAFRFRPALRRRGTYYFMAITDLSVLHHILNTCVSQQTYNIG